MVRDVHKLGVNGRYVVLYDGEGLLNFGFDGRVVWRGSGRLEVQVTLSADLACELYWDSGRDPPQNAYCTDNGVLLSITKTNPANPIRNIRILMPSFEDVHQVCAVYVHSAHIQRT